MPKQAFVPPKLPPEIDYNPLIDFITKAHRAIATLDVLLSTLPNPGLLGRTLQTKEAVLSSKIEGTQATLDEVLQYEAHDEKKTDTEKRKDIREIIKYRKALDLGVKKLKNQPLSENLIKELHAVLLRSGRGKNKAPGAFRKVRVYIGNPGASIEKATFVLPPANKIVSLF